MKTDALNEAEIRACSEAIQAAIGWIAAGTNEGNHVTSTWVRSALANAGLFFRDLEAVSPEEGDER